MAENQNQKKPTNGPSESEQVLVRRQKLADLQAAGNDPFVITKFDQNAYSEDLKAQFVALEPEAESGVTVRVAGRMMSKR
ncbi:MAG: lysine--tRNA ligase, partial [Oscillospiraceae bacterium]|nr:lysine--tRNA ligase [Oscillospiraceae bacterium]